MLPDSILIGPGAFLDMCASSIEAYNCECVGFLTGAVRRKAPPQRRLRIRSAYPQQFIARRPSSAEESNAAAGVRTREVLRALSYMRGVALVGGYHSHPGSECEPSKTDLEYALDELREAEDSGHPLPYDAWLEVIVSIRKRAYGSRSSPDTFWSVRHSAKKTLAVIQTSPRVGYHLTFGAFWIRPEGGRPRWREAKVRMSR